MQEFQAAPWSTALKVVSTVATAVLAAVAVLVGGVVPRAAHVPAAFGLALLALPIAIFVFAVLFVVRGYALDGATLHVERALWRTTIPLRGLTRAWHDPNAMSRSLRIFGNGGLYSVTGLFENAALGRYRAFVTDPKSAVVLQLESGVVVVSPAHPQAFLGHLQLVAPGVSVGR